MALYGIVVFEDRGMERDVVRGLVKLRWPRYQTDNNNDNNHEEGRDKKKTGSEEDDEEEETTRRDDKPFALFTMRLLFFSFSFLTMTTRHKDEKRGATLLLSFVLLLLL